MGARTGAQNLSRSPAPCQKPALPRRPPDSAPGPAPEGAESSKAIYPAPRQGMGDAPAPGARGGGARRR